MKRRISAEVFSPGEFIRDELEARGWTQDDLARIIGRPQAAINLIINDKRGITAETAIKLSGAFGTSAEFWLNLDCAYKLQKFRSRFGWMRFESEQRRCLQKSGVGLR